MYSAETRKQMEHVNKKWVRVLAVITYVISVSVVALVLGLYYKLAWRPKYEQDPRLKGDDANNTNIISLGVFSIFDSEFSMNRGV